MMVTMCKSYKSPQIHVNNIYDSLTKRSAPQYKGQPGKAVRGKIPVYSENHKKPWIHSVGKDAEIVNVRAGGAHSNHWALKGCEPKSC
jgi:hypothetical protein